MSPSYLLPSLSSRLSQNEIVAPLAGAISNAPEKPLSRSPVRMTFARNMASSVHPHPPPFFVGSGESVTDDPAFKTMRGWATILETEGAISGTPVVDQHWKVKVVEEASGSRLMAKVQPGLIITFR